MSAAERKRTRRRRIVVALLVLVGLRVLLALSFSWIVELGARSIGLTSEYEHAALSLARGRLVLQGLELRDRGPDGEPIGEPVVALDYLAADIALLALFTGDVRLQRADVDGLAVRIERDERGLVDWVERLRRDVPAADEEDEEPAPVTLDAPIAIDALRVQRAVLHVVDRAVEPAFETRLVVDARLSHVGSATSAAEFELEASAVGVLDRARIELAGTSAGRTARVHGAVRIEGVRLEALRAELAELGLAPDGHRLDARTRVELVVEPAGASSDPSHAAREAHGRAVAPRVEITAVELEVDGASCARLARAEFAADAVSSELLLGVRTELEDGELVITRRAAGNGSAALNSAPMNSGQHSTRVLAARITEAMMPRRMEGRKCSIGARRSGGFAAGF